MYRRFATYIGKEEKDLSSSPPFRVHTPYPSLWVDKADAVRALVDGMVFLKISDFERGRRPEGETPLYGLPPQLVAVSTPKEHHFPGY
jgi:hypothetical protein